MTPHDYGEWTLYRWGTEETWLEGHHHKDTTANVHYFRDGVQILDPKWWSGRYIIKGNFQ